MIDLTGHYRDLFFWGQIFGRRIKFLVNLIIVFSHLGLFYSPCKWKREYYTQGYTSVCAIEPL